MQPALKINFPIKRVSLETKDYCILNLVLELLAVTLPVTFFWVSS